MAGHANGKAACVIASAGLDAITVGTNVETEVSETATTALLEGAYGLRKNRQHVQWEVGKQRSRYAKRTDETPHKNTPPLISRIEEICTTNNDRQGRLQRG